MNTTLTTQRRLETAHEIQQRQQVRRVGLVDRAALHLGIALIKWGRRPGNQPERERRANRLERALLNRDRNARAAAGRERALLHYALMARMR
ncbi:hypothetical protein BH09ACT4_BH09ACT4_09950 [soil metagenome]